MPRCTSVLYRLYLFSLRFFPIFSSSSSSCSASYISFNRARFHSIRFDSIHLIESVHFHDNWNIVSVTFTGIYLVCNKAPKESRNGNQNTHKKITISFNFFSLSFFLSFPVHFFYAGWRSCYCQKDMPSVYATNQYRRVLKLR